MKIQILIRDIKKQTNQLIPKLNIYFQEKELIHKMEIKSF